MKVDILNFRKIQHAAIDIDRVSIIGGLNEQGKTSIAQAISSALTGQLPFKLTKAELKNIIRTGTEEGSVNITIGEHTMKKFYPDGSQTGAAFNASVIACGGVRFGNLPEKERAKIIIEALKALPTKKELEIATGGSVPIDPLWQSIEDFGWDVIASKYSEKAKTIKGQWAEVAGEAWGSKKGASWRPEGFDESVSALTREAIVKTIETHKTIYEEALKSAAIDEAKLEELKAFAAEIPEITQNYKEIKAERELIVAQIADIVKQRNNMPSTIPDDVAHDCPHCAGKIRISVHHGKKSMRLEKFVEASEKQLDVDKDRMEAAALSGHEENRRSALSAIEKKIALIAEKGKKAREAEKTLKAQETSENGVSEEDIKIYAATVAKWNLNLAHYDKVTRAHALNADISTHLGIAEQLGADGIRKSKLLQVLGAFNNGVLKALARDFGLEKSVSINDSMNVVYGDFEYRYSSESAKYRMDIIIQLALAKIENSPVVVIDGADIIVGKDRGGLIKMLFKSGLNCLVLMALKEASNMPDISKQGGKTYWIENGVTTPFTKEAA